MIQLWLIEEAANQSYKMLKIPDVHSGYKVPYNILNLPSDNTRKTNRLRPFIY